MTKSDKIRARIARADRNLTFDEVANYLNGICGKPRVRGSHHTWKLPDGYPFNAPRGKGGTIKRFYIRDLHIQLAKRGL